MKSAIAKDPELPSSLYAEITILGGMLVESQACEDALGSLDGSEFSLDSHRRIYRAIVALVGTGSAVDTTTLTEQLLKRKELDAIGGRAYLFSLTEGLPCKLSIGSYIRIVKEKAAERELLHLANEIPAAVAEGSPENVRAWIAGRLQDIADQSADEPLETIGAYITREQPDPQSMFTTNARSMGVLTPWVAVNTLTCGLQPAELIIIAGRPAMGKSAFALNLVDYVVRRSGKRVAFFSTEMPMPSLLARLYCGIARVDTQKLRNGSLDHYEKAEVLRARTELQDVPLFMTFARKRTATWMRHQALRLHRKQPLDLIVVDQLSGVSRSDCKERDKHQKIGEQTGMFKDLADELKVPVVILNQLTRSSTDRKDSKPMLSDLKESGSLEEDADVVIFVHRPEYYDRTDESLRGKGEIIIAKQRNGPVGTAHVDYSESFCTWRDSECPELSY